MLVRIALRRNVSVALLAVAATWCAAGATSAAPQEPPKAPEAQTPSPPKPVPAEVAAEVERIRGLLAKHAAADALRAAMDGETKLGAHAALRLEAARAHLAMADEEMSGRADGFLVQGHIADAQLAWKRAAELDPEARGAAALRGRILRAEGKTQQAKDLLTAHMATHATDADALTALAEIATAEKEWETADTRWTRVRELEPSNGRAWLESTLAKQWIGMPAEQIERGYLEACRLLPDDDRALRLLAGIAPNDREKKLALFAKVIEQNPKAVWARVWIAHVLRKEGTPDLAGAVKALAEAAKLAPAHGGVRLNYAEILAETKAPPLDVLTEYAAAAEALPAGGVASIAAPADEILHAGKTPVPLALRIRAYDAIIPKLTGEGWLANNAGFWFRDKGRDYAKSLHYYLLAVEAQPDEQDFLNDCALIYLFHLPKDVGKCLPMFTKVVDLVEKQGQPPKRGYWDTLENLCKYWWDRKAYTQCLACAEKRMDPNASVEGRRYPSRLAESYRARAKQKISEAGTDDG